MKIVVHIDRLMLEGLPANTDVRRLGAEIERELSKSLSERPARWQGVTIDRVASSFGGQQPLDTSPDVGRGVASAVHYAIDLTQPGKAAMEPRLGGRR